MVDGREERAVSINFERQRLLIENMPVAFARHRLILDQQGNPVDYLFLEINSAFEKMTGLSKERVLGKTVREVYPNIDQSEFDWIGIYGKVALSGETISFERYSEPAGRWYDVIAYSDESGHFITLFYEITTQKKELHSIKKLLLLTNKLIASTAGKIDYREPAEAMKELSGASYVAINTYEDKQTKTMTRYIAGLPSAILAASRILGFQLTGHSWTINPQRRRHMEGGRLHRFKNLHEMAMGTLTEENASRLQKMFKPGDIYVIEMAYGKQKAIGDIIFFMPQNRPIQNREMIELYAGQLSSYLNRLEMEEARKKANENLNAILDNTLFGVAIIDKKRIIRWINPVVLKMVGVESSEEIVGKHCREYLCPADQADCPILDRGKSVDNSERILRRRDGREIPILKSVREINLDGEEVFLETFIDLSERKNAEKERINNEKRLQILVDISQHHYDSIQQLLDDSLARALELTASKVGYIYHYEEEKEEFILNSWSKEVMKECLITEKQTRYELAKTGIWGEVVRQRAPVVVNDFQAPHSLKKGYPEGHVELYRYLSIPVFNNGRIEAVIGVANKETDYTNTDLLQLNLLMDSVWKIVIRKKTEEHIQYISFHDQLTGLYNRHYLENEMHRLEGSREYPIAIISADLDGLKLINDSLGHREGDSYLQAGARLLKENLRSADILARVGGDEFALLLPRTNREAAKELVTRIYQSVERYNRGQRGLPLSISLGFDVSENSGHSLEEIFSTADTLMYKNKLKRGREARREIVGSMLSMLSERDEPDNDISTCVREICARIGRQVGLNSEKMAGLLLLAGVQDLGMVSVPKELLHGKNRSIGNEWQNIQQHAERGYRIAQASPELAGIAELILHHHENWDGSGYPLGLKGEEIPIECRIVAIATEYCRLVSGREALNNKNVLDVLVKKAGIKFDPNLIVMLRYIIQG